MGGISDVVPVCASRFITDLIHMQTSQSCTQLMAKDKKIAHVTNGCRVSDNVNAAYQFGFGRGFSTSRSILAKT